MILMYSSGVYSQTAFFRNDGQWEKEILYKSDFNSGKLYIEDGMLNYNFYDTKDMDKYVSDHHQTQKYDDHQELNIKGHCLKTNFINSNKNLKVSELEKIKEYANFYIGNEPSKWASKVPAFQNLVLENLYTNIDLKLTVNPNGYKYDFIVKPYANEAEILIEYLGAEKVEIESGNLRIATSVNDIIEQKPYAYQIVDGEKRTVACHFILKNDKVSFSFPEGFDNSKELIIDPVIIFSRISGSSADNFGYTATYDSKENAYGAGSVFSFGFITTPGAFDLTFDGGSTDVGILKYSSDGLQRLFATYLGGNQPDLPHSLVVNSRDELYVLGTTGSNNFPTNTNFTPFDAIFNGGTNITLTGINVQYFFGTDLFITRFKEDGTALLASTYLGGSDNDGLNTSSFLNYNYADEIRGEILLDKEDNCYIVSCTNSLNFPVGPSSSSVQMTHGGNLDAVVVKMDENLTNVLWSSFLGGQFDDAIYSIDFDNDQNLIMTGGTNSDDFPLVNAYQNTFGGGVDGFVTRLHSSGSAILSSTYFGSANYDQFYFVEVNSDDEVHLFGQTKAPTNDFVFNATYNQPNGSQIITKFNKTVDTLVWSTRFGDGSGIPDISPTAFLVDICNRVFLSGWGWQDDNISGTSGLDVTADAIDNTTDNEDFYFMVLKDDASALEYASFFGGSQSREHVDGGTSRFDKKGTIYQAVCASCGGNQDFPIVPAGNNWTNGSSNCNLGVVKYDFLPPSVIADFLIPPTDCAPDTLLFVNTSQTISSQVEYIWTVNGQTFNTEDLNFTFSNSGVYEIKLVVHDTLSCNLVDSVSKQLTIIGNGLNELADIGICNSRLTQIGIPPISNDNISYSWTPDFFISATDISNPYTNSPIDTIYQLIVSNGNCADTFIQKVILGEINVEINPFDTVCLETNITLNATSIEGSFYNWEPENLLVSGQGTPNATFYVKSNYQEIYLRVRDLEGCFDDTVTYINTFDNLPDLSVFADPDTIEASQASQLLAESIEGNVFLWEANTHFTTLDITNPYAENIIETTTFNVSVKELDDINECYKRDSVTVYVVIPECLDGKFFIPNAFSPNGDGNNDLFKVRTTLINIQDFYLAVYDRWGNKIFETKDKTEGWDGTYNGAQLSPNVYGWYTEGICPGGEEFFLKGNVTLLK
jgi:gliding motility-associated-like protein